MPVAALSQWLRASDFTGRRKGVTGQSHLHLGALKKDSTGLKAALRIARLSLGEQGDGGGRGDQLSSHFLVLGY